MACPCEAAGASVEETATTKNVELAVVLLAAVIALGLFLRAEKRSARART